MMGELVWKQHVVRAGPYEWCEDKPPDDPRSHRNHVEPWLAALVQAEHLNLLIGSGLTLAISSAAGASAPDMSPRSFEGPLSNCVRKFAESSAGLCRRGQPNVEDQIRTILQLLGGLRIISTEGEPHEAPITRDVADQLLRHWEGVLTNLLADFYAGILTAERQIQEAFHSGQEQGRRARYLLGSFLLTFASRPPTRERLHIFTTNYDRLIEYGCDLIGLRIVDRFVGQITPVFQTSRLGIDLHYHPPGIRGEPRYLEGVVRLTKLHGSIDWRQTGAFPSRSREIRRYAIPFGGQGVQLDETSRLTDNMIIYPNPAKDIETLEYPYADLFRDFAAAVCQPNTVVVTYGYGFGDDHVNRILRDMLTIPSTHLTIISYDTAGDRIPLFCEDVGRREQITLLIGNHFGDLGQLVDYYLPKPAMDETTWRVVEVLKRRRPNETDNKKGTVTQSEWVITE